MTRIAPPPTDGPYSDRLMDCQMAMEDAFQDLADRSVAAGWTADEVVVALAELAINHVMARMAAERQRIR